MSESAQPNRLLAERSPYLQQHAHNPVEWYPWGEEALQRARDAQLPIFLSIGYSTCHWCHVMERESFENEATASLMNQHFVCIKVDREERPDLDEIYMNACQLMTGRGGWPLSVFLMPDLRPFFAGTYFPPEDRHGMRGFPAILRMIADAWQQRRDEVERAAAQLGSALQGLELEAADASALDAEHSLQLVDEQLRASFDARFGGWGSAPKFPRVEYGQLCLRRHFRDGDEHALEMAFTTLDRMAAGGIYDHLGGGFHRYSTDAEWLAPHFEKMLYDNAQLALHYCEAFQLSGDPDYARVARETLDYLLRDMRDPHGGFYSAEDADSEGEEGTFYVWSLEQIRTGLDDDQRDLFVDAYDVSARGNWEGHNILRRVRDDRELADRHGTSEAEVAERLAAARQVLLRLREKRPRPHRDEKVLAAWNGLAIEALARASVVLDESRYLDAARACARFVLDSMHDGRTLLRSWRDGEAGIPAYAEDHAYLVAGLLELYQTGFELEFLDAALRIQGELEANFAAPAGGYFHTRAGEKHLIVRVKSGYDGSTPSANSVAARNLLRLFELSGDSAYHERAVRAWSAFAVSLRERPMALTHMMLALDSARGPRVELVLAGALEDPELWQLLRRARSGYHPDLTIAHAAAGAASRLPALAGKAAVAGPLAYVCGDFHCQQPTPDAEEMVRQLGLRHGVRRQEEP